MTGVSAVVFDIGNVLIGWDPGRFYDARIGAEARQRLFAEVDLAGMNARIDAGAGFRETVYALAGASPPWAEEIRFWHDHWIEMASPAIEGSVALLRVLRRNGVPVFALSNFGTDSFALAQRHYDFLNEFDRSYISGHLGVMKPEAEIYRRVEGDCGIAPAALLFADDKRENVDAAAARGWQVHLFTSPEGFARRLVEAGLLTEAEAAG